MEINKKEIDNTINPIGNLPLPRPIQARKCECDCGYTFHPKRRDQIYLNKQHADFAYNHGKRKAKNRNRNKIEKILLRNDRIFDKHYKPARNVDYVDCHYDVIKAEGFDFAYHAGKGEEDGVDYYFTYNYNYYIYIENKIKMIKILKQ
jgi:hypothetical protein